MQDETYGQMLRRLRGPMSLRKLESKSGWNFGYLGQIERGEKLGSFQVANDCDIALGAEGALVAKFHQSASTRDEAEHTPAHTDAWPQVAWAPSMEANNSGEEATINRRGFLGSIIASTMASPLLPLGPTPAGGEPQVLALGGPAGVWFPGTITPAIACDATTRGNSVLIDTRNTLGLQTVSGARQLLIGIAQDGRHFAIDATVAASRHRQGLADAPMRLPQALLLDEFTAALLWALTNLEHSLHADDAKLDGTPPDATDQDLTPASQAWLGSGACATHILSNLDRIDQVPHFWTRERSGEEASAWLFFGHKVAYLEATRQLYQHATATATRTFCIPETLLTGTTTQERLLLLLAMALMESFSVTVRICTHPEYAATDGFATDSRSAIIATWVRAANHVTMDAVTTPAALTEFDDAIRHTHECNAAPGASPTARLEAAAAYLGLDWRWFRARCTALTGSGLDALLVSRSRHLTTTGPQRACEFVAQINQPNA